MSKLSSWDLRRSGDPSTGGLDLYCPDEIEPLAYERYFDRVRFLRLSGYALGAAIIDAWRMGRGRGVNPNYLRQHPVLRPEFDPPTPAQMFARLGLLVLIALGFALVAELIIWFPVH
jgi:hypothetical protein